MFFRKGAIPIKNTDEMIVMMRAISDDLTLRTEKAKECLDLVKKSVASSNNIIDPDMQKAVRILTSLYENLDELSKDMPGICALYVRTA